MGYEELYEKYQKLLEENKKLRSENEDYQKQLGLALPIFSREVQNKKEVDRISSDLVNSFEQVTNDSSPEGKIKLFMSIFRGRNENNEYGYCSLIKAAKRVLDKLEIENRTLAKITSREREDI